MTGALWATISGIGFGFFQSFNRRAGRTFDAYFSTFILIAVSAFIMAGASVLTQDLSQLNNQPLTMYVDFALAGLVHFYLGWKLLTISQNKIGAARTGALSGTAPLFALFISALAFNEFLRPPVLGGILMLVSGVYLVSFDKNPFAGASGRQWIDSLYGLGIAVCFSISPIFIRGGLKYLDSPLLGVTIGMSFSALAYGILLLFRRAKTLQGPLTNDATIFLLAASIFVGLSTWTRWIALDKAAVGVVLALGRLNVPVVLILAPMLVGKAQESVTLRVWIGATLIIAGSLILNFLDEKIIRLNFWRISIMKSHYEILQHLLKEKAVAIVRLDSGEQLVKVAEALKAGGITVIEFTMSTPGALDMVKEASTRFGGDVLLGAGTVLDPETARAAILAGAEFIVTPTGNLETIQMCKRYGKPIVVGAMTPTEMLTVWEAGADLVKVFPASNVGGPDYIKAVLAPLPQLRLVPTGGVSADNAAQYLKAGAAAVAVGGNLVNKKAVANGDWSTITAEAQKLMEVVRSAAS